MNDSMNDNIFQAFTRVALFQQPADTTGVPRWFGEWWLDRHERTGDLWASARVLIVHVGARFTIISRRTCEPVICYTENTPLRRVLAALRGLDTYVNTAGIVHQLTGRE